jgi:hypothetical protein
LDTAFVLTQLQEEVSVPTKRWTYKKNDCSSSHKIEASPSFQLPIPPKQDKPIAAQATDRRTVESAKAKSAEDHWITLRAYRRAQGLCQRCVEPWSKGHSCSERIQQQMVKYLA